MGRALLLRSRRAFRDLCAKCDQLSTHNPQLFGFLRSRANDLASPRTFPEWVHTYLPTVGAKTNSDFWGNGYAR